MIGSMPALGAQSTVQLLGSGGSDGLDAPPSPSCATPAFTTTATFDPIGNPSAEPRFGDGLGLLTEFSLAGFSVDPGVVHFDEVITHDGYTTRPDDSPQVSERVHFELLLGDSVVATTQSTPDLADGPRSTWLAASLGSVTVPDGADGLRIVHDGDGASPNSLIVTALCLRSETALSTVPVDEPADAVETPPAEVAPQTEPAPDPASVDPGTGPDDGSGDGSADGRIDGTGDGTADSAVRPPNTPADVLPTTGLPQLALTGAESSTLTNLAALLLGTGTALVIAGQRRRRAASPIGSERRPG